VFVLAMQGYSSEYWLTFKQANDLGGTVMKGQHGTHITKFSTYNRKEKNEDGEVESTSRASFWHTYTVFNLQQCNPELGAALGLTNTEPNRGYPCSTSAVGRLSESRRQYVWTPYHELSARQVLAGC
jgi:hypothetical protein